MHSLKTIISNLLLFNPIVGRSARLPWEETYAVQIKPLSNEVSVNFNMFSYIILHWIMSYANSRFIITIESHWFIALYPRVFQDAFCHSITYPL